MGKTYVPNTFAAPDNYRDQPISLRHAAIFAVKVIEYKKKKTQDSAESPINTKINIVWKKSSSSRVFTD